MDDCFVAQSRAANAQEVELSNSEKRDSLDPSLFEKDLPLPPARADFRMASKEHFMQETAQSFKPLALGGAFALRETDVEQLSGGAVGARVFRTLPGAAQHGTPWHYHEWGLQVGYITKGWAIYEFEGVGVVRVEAGTFL